MTLSATERQARATESIEQEAVYHGIEAVRAALEEIIARGLPETEAAAREWVNADLAAFPPAFRARVERAFWSYRGAAVWGDLGARMRIFELSAARERGTLPSRLGGGPRGCSCDCRGASGAYASALREIRRAARELRNKPRPTARAILEDAKDCLVVALWMRGERRIDRLQLGQHAIDDAKHELEELQGPRRGITSLETSIRNRTAYLERNVTKGGHRKGLPIADRKRVELSEGLDQWRGDRRQMIERVAHLERLLSADLPRLVREFTSCARGVAA